MRQKLAKLLKLFAVLFFAMTIFDAAAQTAVTGIVKDSSGESIPGASIRVKGSENSTAISNIDGKFMVNVPDLNSTLVVSFIGYVTQDVPLNGRSAVDIVLKEDSQMLEEVVAIGYGVAKKVSLTGSVSAITSKELNSAPMTNPSNLLTGKIAGLTAVQSTGRPGSDQSSIHVRGLNDFAGSGPLCIVDGVPANMDNVNPNDIESVSVLKDAAAAIYGVQGANGVILVTTKRGNEGKAKISYSGVMSVVRNTAMPELMNAREYMYWHNRASEMDGYTPRYTADIQQQVLENAPGTIYGETDWQDQVWRTAFTQRHTISATGGTKNAKYFVSLGILDQEGTMKKTDFRRYNLRSNLDITVTKGLTFAAQISGYKAERYNAGFDLGNTYAWNPAFEATHALPIYKDTYNGLPLAQTTGGDDQFNPGASLQNSGWQRNYNNQVMTNMKLEFDFAELVPLLKGLKVSVWGNYYYGQTKIRNFMNYYEQYIINKLEQHPKVSEEPLGKKGTTPGGGFLKFMEASDGWILRPQVDYSRTFGKHSVTALYVYEAQKNSSESMQANANQFAATDPIDLSLGVYEPNSLVGGHGYTSVVSHIGRFSYDFDNKYLFDFSFRYDGSYKFAPENRWGFFPSVSAGWVISSEPFITENAPWLTFLKLRASWGKSGKDNITPFLYNATFNTAANSIVFGDTVYKNYWTDSYLQRNLKWSTTESYNIGLDFDILDRKLGAEIDVFYQYTNNLLEGVNGEYAPSLGGTHPKQANTGAMDNRGIDFTVNHQLTVNRDFSYRLRGTFGFARNKVLKRNLTPSYPTSLQPRIGQPLGVRYGLKSDGLYQTQEQLDNAPRLDGTSWHANATGPRLGDIRYVDVNGDGRINFYSNVNGDLNTEVLDMVRIGYGTLPEISFSLNADFNYKDFYLNMLWQGVTHCDYMLGGNDQYKWVVGTMLNTAFDQNGNGVKYVAENSWTPEHTDAKYPRLTTSSGGNNILISDFWMVNGEYLRLKNITLGYNVPEKVLTHTPFTGVNVYVSGTNVLTFSHHKYVDPETPSATFNLYPQQATWSLGLNVSF